MKKIAFWIVLSSIVLGGLSGWVFIRYVIPKLNTVNWLVKYNLVPPTGPLVINTRQEIRVNEGSDSVAAIQRVKPWVVGLMSGSDALSAQIKSAGIVLTSDGLIATTKDALAAAGAKYDVAFSDGSVLPANLVAEDPASDLAFIKVSGNNLATTSLGYPKDMQLGQRIIVLTPLLGQYQAGDLVSFLSSEVRTASYGSVISSEMIARTFGVDGLQNVKQGSAIVSLDGNVQGIYGHGEIVTADTIRSALNSYFNSGKIQRNYLGIYYQNVTKSEANMYQTKEGVFVKRPDPKTPAVVAGSPAQNAGIQEGDLITQVDGTQISFDNSFEELLGKHQPGDKVTFTLDRAGQTKNIDVVLGTK